MRVYTCQSRSAEGLNLADFQDALLDMHVDFTIKSNVNDHGGINAQINFLWKAVVPCDSPDGSHHWPA